LLCLERPYSDSFDLSGRAEFLAVDIAQHRLFCQVMHMLLSNDHSEELEKVAVLIVAK
jgi:hypothetical protein